ncbi:hypothetical protein E6O75_ATG08633 [Venturia nashicola]|uniref:Uncharacterized protein n=1 Tax=Venturia nashicola TaxID=86259 RepID=A0A4Z1P5A2_9PEZI|nr:hypothetical protein E6O75_ATG08633 [Venturia nashicola]
MRSPPPCNTRLILRVPSTESLFHFLSWRKTLVVVCSISVVFLKQDGDVSGLELIQITHTQLMPNNRIKRKERSSIEAFPNSARIENCSSSRVEQFSERQLEKCYIPAIVANGCRVPKAHREYPLHQVGAVLPSKYAFYPRSFLVALVNCAAGIQPCDLVFNIDGSGERVLEPNPMGEESVNV